MKPHCRSCGLQPAPPLCRECLALRRRNPEKVAAAVVELAFIRGGPSPLN